jgi:hypothetical protein
MFVNGRSWTFFFLEVRLCPTQDVQSELELELEQEFER